MAARVNRTFHVGHAIVDQRQLLVLLNHYRTTLQGSFLLSEE
jgi:hypothetical protein